MNLTALKLQLLAMTYFNVPLFSAFSITSYRDAFMGSPVTVTVVSSRMFIVTFFVVAAKPVTRHKAAKRTAVLTIILIAKLKRQTAVWGHILGCGGGV